MRTRWIWMVLVAGLCVGCCGQEAPPAEAETGPTMEELEQQVLAADIALDRAVKERDAEAFAELLAEDAVFYGGASLVGRETVAQAWSAFFDPATGMSLTWTPNTVEVSKSGDLGFTRGNYLLTTIGQDGFQVKMSGEYVSIWRRGDDGRWRAAVDIGTTGQPVETE